MKTKKPLIPRMFKSDFAKLNLHDINILKTLPLTNDAKLDCSMNLCKCPSHKKEPEYLIL